MPVVGESRFFERERMLKKNVMKCGLLVLCALSGSLRAAQPTWPDAQEVEKRNAAVAFVSGRELSLGMLLRACAGLLQDASPSMEQVARQWLVRNHPTLERSDAWVNRYFRRLQQNDPGRARSETKSLLDVQTQVLRQAIQTHFGGQIPTREACVLAVRAYATPAMDFANLKLATGYESFGEFADTLARVRLEPGDAPSRTPAKRYADMKASVDERPDLALLTAAEMAGERGDQRLRVSIFERIAEQGDAQAAQTVALAHYHGKGDLPQNPGMAYRWFYQAWALGDPEGLNGMGVMLNQGEAVTRDPTLAYAAFALAGSAGGSEDFLQRVTNNLANAAPLVQEPTRRSLACVSLGGLDAELESRIPVQGPPMRKRALSAPQRRLGALSRELAPHYVPAHCEQAGAGG